jgi:hypothetical protein
MFKCYTHPKSSLFEFMSEVGHIPLMRNAITARRAGTTSLAISVHPAITIRPAYADDQRPLARLAALDSAPGTPAGPLLLAEIDGEPKAALSLVDGSVIADPFTPTADLVALLRHRAGA